MDTPRGMPVYMGTDATRLRHLEQAFLAAATAQGYQELRVPAVWDYATFEAKSGPEVGRQMYTFTDKGGRALCLIPEVTAIVQALYREQWAQRLPKPVRLCYSTRCYRYERPQAGRYREFTQFGVELLGTPAGGDDQDGQSEMLALLHRLLGGLPETAALAGRVVLDAQVRRGLAYYVADGFEMRAPWLGAQQQIAGGGRYAEGIGFAIGVERVALALDQAGQQVGQQVGEETPQ